MKFGDLRSIFIYCGDLEPSNTSGTTPHKGPGLPFPSSEATSARSKLLGTPQHASGLPRLHAKQRFSAGSYAYVRVTVLPPAPYFALPVWPPNSPSAILEQELHLLKKQKTQPNPDHVPEQSVLSSHLQHKITSPQRKENC